MELGPVLEQRVTATPQLIQANALLQISSTALEQAIHQELAENPVLELQEVQRCPRCGLPLSDDGCAVCRARDTSAHRTSVGGHGASAGDDGTSRLVAHTTLAEHLLRQARVALPPADVPIAACVVEQLDERGLLSCTLHEIAALCDRQPAQVQRVIAALQQLDPVGVAAPDARACLLIQLQHLREQGTTHPLAETLIDAHWQALATQSPAQVAKELNVAVEAVEAALRFIQHNLTPYPAHADWGDVHESAPESAAAYAIPDVIIHQRAAGSAAARYEIEIPGEQLYRLRISASYREALQGPDDTLYGQDWKAWLELHEQARLFIHSVQQRWRTLRTLARHLVEHQRAFLVGGEKDIQPLTQAQVAEWMAVHESTISRAVADKYVQLPNGRIVPMAKFFDSAAPIKALIKEIVAQEDEPLSDRKIAEELARRGHAIARRTVSKYRNLLHILPSTMR